MTRIWLGRAAAQGALLMMGTALSCKADDLTDIGGNGGSGGSSSNAGSSGSSGSAGSSGSGTVSDAGGAGGSPDAEAPEAGAGDARFVATLEGDRVVLTALDPVWVQQCNEPNPRLAQSSGGTWTLLRDERPAGTNLQHAAHYVDGALQSDCGLSVGCDVEACVSFAEFLEDGAGFQARLVAREYVQVGQLEAPTCDQEELDAGFRVDAGDAGGRTVPALESLEPEGALAVRFRYFRDDRCETPAITTDIAVE